MLIVGEFLTAAYQGSEEEKKHLMGVALRSTVTLILHTLPIAKAYLESDAGPELVL